MKKHPIHQNLSTSFVDLPSDILSDESKRKIIWDNPVEFYQFPESYIPKTFAEGTAPTREKVSH